MDSRAYRGGAFAALIFLLVQLGALALVPTFFDRGYQAVEDPADPTNSLVYVGAILLATAVMLAAFKYDLDRVVRAIIVFTSGLLSWYVFGAVVPNGVLALALAAGVSLALLAYPEWYVIDAAGVLMGAGAAGLFGISFGLLPAIVLLSVLAVYDAISVYGTEHMLDLASGVMDLRIPVVLVVPLTLSYSLLDDDFSDVAGRDDSDAETGAADEERGAADGGSPNRDAFFIGLGDAVMPSVMVASAAFFSPATPLGVPGVPALNLPALASMAGTFVGLAILLRMVMKGRAHAGLPLLNGGAIGGYLLGSTLAGVSLARALGLAPYL
ncbi:presenilin family intramembrane aspartyl protease PSH [Halegenticoccus tardaugens]|uniref:presenilin family intramembrane aspartyl protease PSH n=1 Tax=Halegenticoccus tardaugens TaxID=2071624 RepID=UPI00100B0474|nr:presenilin family intramembrane aspartyl protease PSH [Halegenticoccus tardaugens]